MAFTNNRPEFRQGQSYTEELHAKALNEGIPSFVNKGLDLTGTTLTSGVAINSGVPGQWGEEGETHTITANYTGFIILKTVLDGANGLNSIVEDTVRNDTDPRSTEKTRYFTIYELNNGVIVQDFRHINYVKELTFIQGPSGVGYFQMVLNGFTSNEFNMPALVGNVLSVDGHLPDVNGNVIAKQHWSLDELGLDGTWVINDLPGNIKKAYDKIVTLIGTGTTFTITQSLYRNIDADHYEFSQSIEDSIIDSYGTGIGTDVFEFSITFGLYNDLTGIDNTNYILIKSSLGSFTRQFNFNGWSGTKWSDASGALSAREARFLIGNGNGTFSNTITLTDSAFNYRKLLVRVVLGGSTHKYHEISTNDFSLIKSSMLPYAQGTAGVSFHSLEFELSANGTSITLPSTSTHYVTFTRMDDNAVSQTTTTDCGIVEIYGIGRLLPEGTTHSLFGEPKIETPNIEPEVGTND